MTFEKGNLVRQTYERFTNSIVVKWVGMVGSCNFGQAEHEINYKI